MSQIATYRQFPVCVEESSEVGDGTAYPIGLDLEKTFELLWRSKLITSTCTVDIDSAITFQIGGDPPPDPIISEFSVSGTASIDAEHEHKINSWRVADLLGADLTDETQLVCPRAFALYSDTDYPATNYYPLTSQTDEGDPNNEHYITIAFVIDLSAPIRKHEGLFYPHMEFAAGNYNFTFYSHQDNDARPSAVWQALGQLSVLGETCPLYIDTNPAQFGDTAIDFTISGTATFAITVHTEWPFDP